MSNLNNKRQQYCCSCSVSCDAAIMPPVPRMRTTASAVRQISSEHAPIFRHWVGHAQNGYPISEPVIRRALRGISIEWMPTEKVMSRGFWTRVQFPPVPPNRAGVLFAPLLYLFWCNRRQYWTRRVYALWTHRTSNFIFVRTKAEQNMQSKFRVANSRRFHQVYTRPHP